MFVRSIPFPAILVCALFFLTEKTPRAADAAETTARIQRQYTAIGGFEANFEQMLTHRESGAAEKRKGTLLFQKPFLVRWETEKPHQELLVVTSREIWDYLPDEDLAYRYPLSMVQDSRSIIQVITGQAALTKDFDVKPDGEEGNFVRLKLHPREPGPQMVEAVIWADKTDGYIRRAELTDFYGNKNTVRFTSFNPQTQFRESDFSFTPPAGVEVEDHSKKKTRQRELFN
ncbi:MAG: outer membrane lipoprotein carrier protein LolA [Desulfovibrio sp.]|jgi:outer membrane lipoprotein carrier protein|nr:outer membrane lipoprotein carrier protein LolA [Desulfovibrio sp.]